MSRRLRSYWGTAIALLFMLFATPGHAGTVVVSSAGAPVVITVDGAIVGPTELKLDDLKEGQHRLGFRSTTFAADAFSETITITKDTNLSVVVDLPARRATIAVVEAELAAEENNETEEAVEVSEEEGSENEAENEAPAAEPSTAEAEVASETEATPAEPPEPQIPLGDLYILTSIEGAELSIKSGEEEFQPIEQASPTLLKGIPVGTYTVTGRTTCGIGEATVEVLSDRITRTEISLEPKNGTIEIVVSPPEAMVFLDGNEVAAGSLRLKDISCGEHEITVRANNHIEGREQVTVASEATTKISIALEKESFGALVVSVDPFTTHVSVDGVEVATGPITIEPIAAGEHSVTASLEGYKSITNKIMIESDGVSRIDFALEQKKKFPHAGRNALNTSVSALGLGAAALGLIHSTRASKNFAEFLSAEELDDAQALYNDIVLPDKKRAVVELSAAVVLLGTGAALWVSTDYSQAAPRIGFSGRW